MLRVPTFWFCFVSVFGAILFLPIPGFGFFGGFYLPTRSFDEDWAQRMFIFHTIGATLFACFCTRRLSRSALHGTQNRRGLPWLFGYTTFCAFVLGALHYAGASFFVTATLMIPVVAYFFVPWMLHGLGPNHVTSIESQ